MGLEEFLAARRPPPLTLVATVNALHDLEQWLYVNALYQRASDVRRAIELLEESRVPKSKRCGCDSSRGEWCQVCWQPRSALYKQGLLPENLWSIGCGCDHHGDHGGCDEECKNYGSGCVHPLGVYLVTQSEVLADRYRGELPRWSEVYRQDDVEYWLVLQ